MKRLATAALVLLALAALISQSDALQRGPDDNRPRQGDGPPPPPHHHRGPYLDLFDTDEDGELSADEIQAAATVLQELDSNGDGRLTRNELPRPPRPGDRHDHGHRDHQDHGNREQGHRVHGNRDEGPAERRPRGPREERRDRPRPRDDERAELAQPARTAQPGEVVFTGGHETDRRDGGRPVALIAAALGVESQVFRDAFSRVTPARGGDGPSPALARRNRQVLMDALGKHGITNDRLDEVSNFYRYRPEDGELWKHAPARATAILEDGKVTGFRITSSGFGYTTPPRVTVAGHEDLQVEATLGFSTDMRENGRVTELKIVGE